MKSLVDDMQSKSAHELSCVCSTELASQLFSRRCDCPNPRWKAAHQGCQAGGSGAQAMTSCCPTASNRSNAAWPAHVICFLMSMDVMLQVLTANPNGKQAFETVFMFSHYSAERTAHVSLTTQSNFSLSLTAGHYLWVTKAHQSHPSIVRAGDVHVGDAAWISTTASAKTNAFVTDTIAAIAIEEKNGLYNPHTPSGCIVVNGLAALTFTETIPSSCLWHSIVTMPARIIFNLLPLHVAAHLNHVLLSAYFTLPVHLHACGVAIAAISFQLRTFCRLLTYSLAVLLKAGDSSLFSITPKSV